MKNHQINFRMGAIYIIAFTGLAGNSMADGYRNPPMTAEALGKAGNAIVFTDDASAVEYNPANLAFQTNASFVASITLAQSDTTYNDGITGRKATPDDSWVPLPNIFFSIPLGDSGVALGLGITTPYGQGSEFGRKELYEPFSLIAPSRVNPLYEAQMTLININPTVAFQINDKLAVGGGVDFFISRLEFKQYFPWTLFGGPVDGDADVDSYGYGVGGNLGITWNVTEKQRLALTYRSAFKIDYDGDFEVSNFQPIVPGTSPKSDFSTEIEFPNVIGVGYGIELTDTVRIEANFEWQEWSSNESLEIDVDNNQPLLGGDDEIVNDWNDSIILGVGGDWQFADNWVLRLGYRFLETPIPDETLAPYLPDMDQHSFSVGLGYQAGAHAIDVAYTYSIYEDRDISAAENPLYPGDYDIDSHLVGLTYSLSF